jgi:predicted NAD/FAD-binding protein
MTWNDTRDVAVIGSGISGLACAWLLSARHRVTLFEAAERLGGHSNTAAVASPAGTLAVDTGFIVYNERTYPNLTALFRHLGVATQPSDMSFAVSLDDGALEYAGTSLAGLFAQRRNLIRPRFWAMLRDLLRFYRAAPRDLAALEADGRTLGAYLDAGRFGRALQDDHLLPMGAAIWSAPPGAMRDHPAAAFIRFCATHGLLALRDRPVWRTVTGGSRRYVAALAAPLAGRIRCEAKVAAVRRDASGVTVQVPGHAPDRFDDVVIATHADQALAMLPDADAAERQVLGAFRYSRNLAVLHSDSGLMPKRRAVWSSWNYLGRRDGATAPAVSYWMNRLQNLPSGFDLFVTLNPPRPPHAGTLLRSERYDHPVFDGAALAAQRELWALQGRRRTWFCGAHFGAGFHEDGLQAGLAVAEALGGVRRPWQVADESGRIFLPATIERAAAA